MIANDITAPNYPFDNWWFAAKSDQLGSEPIGLWMLDKPVILFRTSDGTATALDNRCPHRWAPLSMGKVDGDAIRCPYHGFAFAADGQCVDIPSQTTVPGACKVQSFPLVERNGLIWVWLGDAAKAANTDLPCDTSWILNPDYTVIDGVTVVDANYQLLKENVLDLTHLPHVHEATIAIPDWKIPPKVTVDGQTIRYELTFDEILPPPHMRIPTGLPEGHKVSMTNLGESFSPGVHQSKVIIKDPTPKRGARDTFTISILHVTTPESHKRFRYQWFFAWDIKLPEPAVAIMRQNVPSAYAEDKTILEAVQAMVERDPRGMNYPEMIVRADEAAIQFRRKLLTALANERSRSE